MERVNENPCPKKVKLNLEVEVQISEGEAAIENQGNPRMGGGGCEEGRKVVLKMGRRKIYGGGGRLGGSGESSGEYQWEGSK